MTATLKVAAAQAEAETEAADNLQTAVDVVDAAAPHARKVLMTRALETSSWNPTLAKASSSDTGRIYAMLFRQLREIQRKHGS